MRLHMRQGNAFGPGDHGLRTNLDRAAESSTSRGEALSSRRPNPTIRKAGMGADGHAGVAGQLGQSPASPPDLRHETHTRRSPTSRCASLRRRRRGDTHQRIRRRRYSDRWRKSRCPHSRSELQQPARIAASISKSTGRSARSEGSPSPVVILVEVDDRHQNRRDVRDIHFDLQVGR